MTDERTPFREVFRSKIDPWKIDCVFYAMLAYNFLHGVILGNIAGLLTTIKSDFDLTTGELGDALSTASIGAVVGIIFIPRLIHDKGSRESAVYATIFFFFTYLMMAVASSTNVYVGIFALVCMGLSLVWMESSMNTQAALTETLLGFPLFGRLQALYAIGAIVGAVIVAKLVDDDYKVWQILSVASVIYFPAILGIVYFLIDQDDELLINSVRSLEKARKQLERERERQRRLRSSHSETRDSTDSDPSNPHPPHPSEALSTSQTQYGTVQTGVDESILPLAGREGFNSGNATSSNPALPPHPSSTPAKDIFGDSIQALQEEISGWIASAFETSQNSDSNSQNSGSNSQSRLLPLPTSALLLKADYRSLWLLTLLIGILSFVEAAVTYFSALFVESDWVVSDEVAVSGFIGYQIGTAVSRVATDYYLAYLSPSRRLFLVSGTVCAGVGMGLIALCGLFNNSGELSLILAIIGFCIVGLGAGPLTPLILGLTTQELRGFDPGDALPLVSAGAMVGIVLAPLVDGNLAENLTYTATFGLQTLILAVAAVLGYGIRENTSDNTKQSNNQQTQSSEQTGQGDQADRERASSGGSREGEGR